MAVAPLDTLGTAGAFSFVIGDIDGCLLRSFPAPGVPLASVILLLDATAFLARSGVWLALTVVGVLTLVALPFPSPSGSTGDRTGEETALAGLGRLETGCRTMSSGGVCSLTESTGDGAGVNAMEGDCCC